MVSVLAVSDEPVAFLWSPGVRDLDVDVVLGAGDLPFAYLEYLSDQLNAPCVFVPGNHDADLSGYSETRVGFTRAGMPATWPGPVGSVNADGRVVTVAGLQIAGLGGSIRYNDGPNQWSERQQSRRAGSLRIRHYWRSKLPRARSDVDVLLTHSPARGIGDADDRPHRGFSCFNALIDALDPSVMIHGHIHPHGRTPLDFEVGRTIVLNTVGFTLMDITPGTRPKIVRRRHGS
ncbi:calcineurin-like phosphoesterase family protein [Rhodococcus sp. 27YEA15]|uniref:metallophosphoesterase family protein n=1 Tax=Rhodococcus sp. 27YEA15 TaxID=3156259 RepID=UPI003C7B638D